jgi:hypothetical protein
MRFLDALIRAERNSALWAGAAIGGSTFQSGDAVQ